jgi:MFS transporter, OFA family, oxalate/formate antiporter
MSGVTRKEIYTLMKNNLCKWSSMIIGEIVMLFIGIIYAWSILKEPFASEFGWTASALALNFTITMICFCLGQLLAGVMLKRFSLRITILFAAVLACSGFMIASCVNQGTIVLLYLSYGILAGLGMGMMFNISVSIPSMWFPETKGTCSGALMMGFGASTLIMGKVSASLLEAFGWRPTYRIIAIAAGVVIALSAFLMSAPKAESATASTSEETSPNADRAAGNASGRDYTSAEMLHTRVFWILALFLVLASSLGNSTISMAKDIALYEGVSANLATILVGLLSLCNGLSRFVMGVVYDHKGLSFTIKLDGAIVCIAAVIALIALQFGGVILATASLCIIGFSYGTQPVVTSSTVTALFGAKNFTMNFAITNLSIIVTSLITTVSGVLLTNFGTFFAPYFMLLVFAVIALILSTQIKPDSDAVPTGSASLRPHSQQE